MVLAAGLGTRLRPLTDHTPKPLVPLGDRPMLSHVVAALRARGEGRIAVNAHHCAEAISEWATAQTDVFVSSEKDLLGTAGGVAHARALLGHAEVLVYNGDIIADVDVAALRAALRGVLCLAVAPRAANEGNVGIAADGRVTRLRKTSFAEEARGGDFLGIYVIARDFVSAFPEPGNLIEDVCFPALARGDLITTFDVTTPFTDLGTKEAYLSANLAWLGARESWAGPRTHVADGVRLKRSIVGEGAKVVGSGDLEECVVWPNATATAPLSFAVVTPHQTVRLSGR
jgi:mannose-1-phosphate guanylyltransferase